MRRKKGPTVTRACACGCGTTFTVPAWNPKKFMNKSHYVKGYRGKAHHSYKTGVWITDSSGKIVDRIAYRKARRSEYRRRNETYKRFPNLTDDVLVHPPPPRKHPPYEVTETILKPPQEKTCPVCRGDFVVPWSSRNRKFCSKSCKTKAQKRNNKGWFL